MQKLPLPGMSAQLHAPFVQNFGNCGVCRRPVTNQHVDARLPIKYDTFGNPLHPLTCEHVYMARKVPA